MLRIPGQKTSFPVLLAIAGLSLMYNCMRGKNIAGFSGFSSASLSYYPLGVGHTWYYDVGVAEDSPDIIYAVEKKFIEDSKTYFIVKHGSGSAWRDTVSQDDQGRIWKRVYRRERLWLDFTLEEGDTYTFQLDTNFVYDVSVTRDLHIQTPAGSFDNCIEFLFDVPETIDEELWLIFAPGIGLLKKRAGEGPTMVLHSYHD